MFFVIACGALISLLGQQARARGALPAHTPPRSHAHRHPTLDTAANLRHARVLRVLIAARRSLSAHFQNVPRGPSTFRAVLPRPITPGVLRPRGGGGVGPSACATLRRHPAPGGKQQQLALVALSARKGGPKGRIAHKLRQALRTILIARSLASSGHLMSYPHAGWLDGCEVLGRCVLRRSRGSTRRSTAAASSRPTWRPTPPACAALWATSLGWPSR
jgi:hypothetical protein